MRRLDPIPSRYLVFLNILTSTSTLEVQKIICVPSWSELKIGSIISIFNKPFVKNLLGQSWVLWILSIHGPIQRVLPPPPDFHQASYRFLRLNEPIDSIVLSCIFVLWVHKLDLGVVINQWVMFITHKHFKLKLWLQVTSRFQFKICV